MKILHEQGDNARTPYCVVLSHEDTIIGVMMKLGVIEVHHQLMFSKMTEYHGRLLPQYVTIGGFTRFPSDEDPLDFRDRLLAAPLLTMMELTL